MTPRKRKQRFSATKAVKAAAREQIGAPPPTRRTPTIQEKQAARAEKHKPTLRRILEDMGE